MDKQSNSMARVLQKYSSAYQCKDYVVAVSLNPNENLPIILMAILKAGMTYLPLDTEYPENRLKYILEDSRPFLCIIEETGN